MKRLDCHEVWQEISNYIDDELPVSMRMLLEAHLRQCSGCAALVDSTRNIVILIGDERAFELPAGFSARLRERLMKETRRA